MQFLQKSCERLTFLKPQCIQTQKKSTRKLENQEEKKTLDSKGRIEIKKLTAVLDFRGVDGRKEKKSSEKERRKHLAEIKRHSPRFEEVEEGGDI